MAKNFSSYVFVVVESTIEDIIKNNLNSPYKSNLSYVWHNVREICHEYKGVCRLYLRAVEGNQKKLIPKILFYGKKLWDVDLQYFIDKNDLGNRSSKYQNEFGGINEEIKRIKGYMDEDEAKYHLYKFLRSNVTFATDLISGVHFSFSALSDQGHAGS